MSDPIDANDIPDPTTQTVEALRILRDAFQTAAIKAIADGDVEMANWARTITDRYGLELTRRARDRRSLEQWIADHRRERPHGTPGDTTGIPPWSEISRDET